MQRTWNLTRIDHYVGGKLPAPFFQSSDNIEAKFLPCNPEKQAQYPNFVGYIFLSLHTLGGQATVRFALEQPSKEILISRRARVERGEISPEGLAGLREALQSLIPLALATARSEGHRFPADIPY